MITQEIIDRSSTVILAGSHMYGHSVETSDKDIRTILTVTEEDFLGLRSDRSTIQGSDGDTVGYSLKHFLSLLRKGSPNTIELLYAPDSCILKQDIIWAMIRANRKCFITKQFFQNYIAMTKNHLEKCVQHEQCTVKMVTTVVRMFSVIWQLQAVGSIDFLKDANNIRYMRTVLNRKQCESRFCELFGLGGKMEGGFEWLKKYEAALMENQTAPDVTPDNVIRDVYVRATKELAEAIYG
jgi:predicted nucleotidyltransferase